MQPSNFSRRDILRAIALGGGVVAGELWIPGQRMISIPTYGAPEMPGFWLGWEHGYIGTSYMRALQHALNRARARMVLSIGRHDAKLLVTMNDDGQPVITLTGEMLS